MNVGAEKLCTQVTDYFKGSHMDHFDMMINEISQVTYIQEKDSNEVIMT